MSNVAERPTHFSPPQQILGLLNHSATSPGRGAHSYPDPLQLHAAAPSQSHTPLPLGAQQSSGRPQNESSRPSTPAEVKGRLRKACDSCSVRKVKCDESGPPCRSCAALDIPCTFERPSRRRGPPNRHAEAIKRQRLEQSMAASSGFSSDDDRQTTTSRLSAESICPMSTLQLLIDDYFTYIHPLIPLPHEPTFRMQFNRRDDLTDRKFLALVANMIAVLVASFPRRPRQLMASTEMQSRYPNAGALIRVCLRVAAEARGPGFLSGRLDLHDALCSYLTGIIYAYTFEFKRARLYFGESLLITRNLNLHRAPEPDSTFENRYPRGGPDNQVDFIKREMGRRLFWVSYVSNQHLRQLGSGDADLLIPPLSSNTPPPPLPLEVDDAWITRTEIKEPPPGLVSEIVGFNANVMIMRACNDLVAVETAVGFDEVNDIDRQTKIVFQCLQAAKHATDSLPPELQLNPLSPSGWPSLEDPYYHSRRTDLWAEEDRPEAKPYGAVYSRRRVQYEIQKANIYATQLATRSYLVEKYWALCELEDEMSERSQLNQKHDPALTAPDSGRLRNEAKSSIDRSKMAYERDNILRDLSVLLSSINQVNMEPNGTSLTNKIRSIASTLLQKGQPRISAPSSLDYESIQQYLNGFIDILMKLERLGPGLFDGSSPSSADSSGWGQGNPGLTAEEIEERELVQWASLKEHQEKFARENGFLRSL